MGNIEEGRAGSRLLERAKGCPPGAMSTQRVTKQGQEHCELLSEQPLSRGAQDISRG